MKTWYSIKAAAKGTDTAEISIFDEIGYWGVTAKDFISEFKAKTKDAAKVALSINSPGGSVFDGFAIFNALKASGKEITVNVMGIAASMASVIAMAGKTINMPANSMMMVHNAISGVYGDAEDLEAVVKVLKDIDNSIVATYVARTGKPDQEVRDLMSADTFMTAARAVELGFADKVVDEAKVTACFELDKLPENVRAMFKASVTPPQVAPTLQVDQIEPLAKAAGVVEFVDVFATDPKLSTVDAMKAAIGEAGEILKLCALVKKPDQAAAFIRGRKSLDDARNALQEARVKADEAAHVDTRPKAKNSSAEASKDIGAFSVNGYWAAQRSKKQ